MTTKWSPKFRLVRKHNGFDNPATSVEREATDIAKLHRYGPLAAAIEMRAIGDRTEIQVLMSDDMWYPVPGHCATNADVEAWIDLELYVREQGQPCAFD